MDRAVFERHVVKLNNALVRAVERHFEDSVIPFDVKVFLDATAMDIDTVVRNALFYGAEVFPIDIPRRNPDKG